MLWKAFLGWTGIDQYDEGNLVGQRFLDQYDAAYGRRPQYCVPVGEPRHRHRAAARLRRRPPLEPARREGGARAGEDATRRDRRTRDHASRFGKWTHRAWMGAGYLVARRLDPDGINSHLVARFGED